MTLFGSIRTAGNINIGRSCIIHGNLSTKGKVNIARNCKVLGKITADTIVLHESSKVDDSLIAPMGVTIERDDLEGLNEGEKRLFYGFTLLEDV